MNYFIGHLIDQKDSSFSLINLGGNKDLPIIKAIQALKLSFLDLVNAKKKLADAETIEAQGQNPYLFLIFLELRAKLAIATERPGEGLAIISQIKSIITEEMPVEYKIIPQICESYLFFKNDNIQLAEEAIEKSLSLLSPLNKRYQYLLLEYGIQLAKECRLNQFKEEIAKINIETSDKNLRALSDLVLFIDCISRCDLDFAKELESKMELDAEILKYYQKDYHDALIIKNVYQFNFGDIGEKEFLLEQNKNNSIDSMIYYELIKKRPADARRILQDKNINYDEYLKQHNLSAFLPLRVELSCGNFELANSLLTLKNSKGGYHFFDHFFLARIEYLAGNLEKALTHFKTIFQECLKNDCMSRLEFELELTYEFKNKDINQFLEYAKNPLTLSNNINPILPKKSELHFSMLGDSPELNSVFENIRQFAPLDLPVLIIGETGTGKELTAQALHAESNRKNKNFLAINCGAISESLLQSELFGYEQGAFTGANKVKAGILEEAGEGTVFLDEIGEISPAIQVALLRVLENNEIRPVGGTKQKKINCRIVAATNAHLSELVEKNLFRKDLFYRLQRFQITLPSLRERKEDIKALALYYLSKERLSKDVTISDKFVKVLENYPWPGNIRELRNEMERIALLNANKSHFTEMDLQPEKFLPIISTLSTKELEINLPLPQIEKKPLDKNPQLPDKEEVEKNEINFQDEESSGLNEDQQDFQVFLNNRNSPLRRKVKLKKIFQKYKSLSRSEVARVMNLALNTAAKDLADLEKEGFIERIQPTTAARTHYFSIVKN